MTDDLKTMRVAHKMKPARFGRWRIAEFTQTAEKQQRDELKIRTSEPPERWELALRRVIPPGDYVSLQRRMIDQEVRDFIEGEIGDVTFLAGAAGVSPEDYIDRIFPVERRWIPIMSDTPDELEGHRPALSFHGAVLVTGLGLGCVVSGLLANPDVTRIDVIEIDPDVVNLTGPYYVNEPRVRIWNVSATDIDALPADLDWDFAWHDIWTHIAERNLRDETAEHGISYGMLFDLWAPRVAAQHAWAYEDALEMRAVNNLMRQKNNRLVQPAVGRRRGRASAHAPGQGDRGAPPRPGAAA